MHTPSSNPNKKPPRAVTLPRGLSRRGNRGAQPTAPSGNSRVPRDEPPPDYSPGYGEEPLPGYNTALRDGTRYGRSMEMR